MAEYADDELPLPSFLEVFGDGTPEMILVSNNAAITRRRLANRKVGSRLGVGDESSGRWTSEEQRLFLEGLMLYGKDWKKMAPLIKTRTLVQIRTHAQKVFKKMGLKMLDRIKRVGQKRGLDDDDDIDEERLNQLKQSGQLEGMIASGELNVGEGDENERLRLNGLAAAPSPHHPNPHLAPQATDIRLPGVGAGAPIAANPTASVVVTSTHALVSNISPPTSSASAAPPAAATADGLLHPQSAAIAPFGVAQAAPPPQQLHQQQQPAHNPQHVSGGGPGMVLSTSTVVAPPSAGNGTSGSPISPASPSPPHNLTQSYMMSGGANSVSSIQQPVQPPPYHQLQLIQQQQQAAMQQQVALQQQQQQQEYLRQQQQFMLHQQLQQEEYQRQVAYQQQQQQQNMYHGPPH